MVRFPWTLPRVLSAGKRGNVPGLNPGTAFITGPGGPTEFTQLLIYCSLFPFHFHSQTYYILQARRVYQERDLPLKSPQWVLTECSMRWCCQTTNTIQVSELWVCWLIGLYRYKYIMQKECFLRCLNFFVIIGKTHFRITQQWLQLLKATPFRHFCLTMGHMTTCNVKDYARGDKTTKAQQTLQFRSTLWNILAFHGPQLYRFGLLSPLSFPAAKWSI